MEQLQRRSALIVVDMQNGFLRDEGSMRRHGRPIDELKVAVPGVLRLVDVFRRVGQPIVFTKLVFRPDYRDAGLKRERYRAAAFSTLVRGSWDAEIIDELTPTAADYTVEKSRHSAFFNTNLEVVLRGEAVETLVVCGVTTEVCVESTVRDAVARDFPVVAATDALAAFDPRRHEAALSVFAYTYARLATVAEIQAVLVGRGVAEVSP